MHSAANDNAKDHKRGNPRLLLAKQGQTGKVGKREFLWSNSAIFSSTMHSDIMDCACTQRSADIEDDKICLLTLRTRGEDIVLPLPSDFLSKAMMDGTQEFILVYGYKYCLVAIPLSSTSRKLSH